MEYFFPIFFFHLSAHFLFVVFTPEPLSKIYALITPLFLEIARLIFLSFFLKKLNKIKFSFIKSIFSPFQPLLDKLYVSDPFIG